MFRVGTLSLLGLSIIAFAAVSTAQAPNDADARFNKALSVQTAMARARILLSERNAQKAVDVLEEQLPKVNGNTEYLVLLRDAYRVYIRDLYLAGQPEQARRYLDRLCILDPSAANDTALRPAADTPPRKFAQETPKPSKLSFPTWKGLNPFAKYEDPKPAEPATVIRALPEASISEDPFDRKNQREASPGMTKQALALELLNRGAAAFKHEHSADARKYFEQAYGTEATVLDSCREQWAYCIIKGVSEAMERPGVLPGQRADLQKQVDAAIQMAPTKMMVVGQQLLQQLEERSKRPIVTASVTKVRHWGQNKEGWQVAETPNFRIFHKENSEFVERVAQIAENTRLAMFRKWFGSDGVEWQPTCELILHPNAGAYTQMTGVPGNSPGHSRIESGSGRIVARRMDMRLDAAGMVDAVLPHETTHVVLAGMFGIVEVPRWCDEGIAVLSEPDDKIEQHRRNLLKHHKDGLLFGLKEIMELKDYPQARRIGPFYAQSVVLTEFLTHQKGPRILTEFVKDGIRQGYEVALQRHYGMTFTQLEQLWQQNVINDATRIAAQK
jgi:tetratricopeptide (TPR) repeat protein